MSVAIKHPVLSCSLALVPSCPVALLGDIHVYQRCGRVTLSFLVNSTMLWFVSVSFLFNILEDYIINTEGVLFVLLTALWHSIRRVHC